MNFRNLKTNFRFIFAGVVGIGLRPYIKSLFPSKILLIVVLIISVLAIITGVIGIYNEFKNRKNVDIAPENNIKPKRIKTKEEKEEIEKICNWFEESFSHMENEIEDLKKNYDKKYKEYEEYRQEDNLNELHNIKEKIDKLYYDICDWSNTLSKEKLKEDDEYRKIENQILKNFEIRLNELYRKIYNLKRKTSYLYHEEAIFEMENDIKDLEEDYNSGRNIEYLKEDFKIENDYLKKEMLKKEDDITKMDPKVFKAFEERMKEIERKIKILEAKYQRK